MRTRKWIWIKKGNTYQILHPVTNEPVGRIEIIDKKYFFSLMTGELRSARSLEIARIGVETDIFNGHDWIDGEDSFDNSVFHKISAEDLERIEYIAEQTKEPHAPNIVHEEFKQEITPEAVFGLVAEIKRLLPLVDIVKENRMIFNWTVNANEAVFSDSRGVVIATIRECQSDNCFMIYIDGSYMSDIDTIEHGREILESYFRRINLIRSFDVIQEITG